jgi:ribosomal protein L11 methyltransferase
MAWLVVTLTVAAESVEAFGDALLDAGALAVDVADAHAGTVFEKPLFAEPGDPVWEFTRVKALFDADHDVTAAMAQALRAAGLDPVSGFQVDHVADQDWVRATQSQFQPVRVSPRLWVVPTWHEPPDPAALNLVIDPGLAFGTGSHPTTRLCLAWLDVNLRGGEHVLDYGCGSGILAIAAMKLGAAYACAVDIDAGALLAARHNAMQNHVAVQFETADETPAGTFDIVLANILANPLWLLAPLLARATRSGGRVVLSGVTDRQADELRGVYREWFDMDTLQHAEGWVLLSGVRH